MDTIIGVVAYCVYCCFVEGRPVRYFNPRDIVLLFTAICVCVFLTDLSAGGWMEFYDLWITLL